VGIRHVARVTYTDDSAVDRFAGFNVPDDTRQNAYKWPLDAVILEDRPEHGLRLEPLPVGVHVALVLRRIRVKAGLAQLRRHVREALHEVARASLSGSQVGRPAGSIAVEITLTNGANRRDAHGIRQDVVHDLRHPLSAVGHGLQTIEILWPEDEDGIRGRPPRIAMGGVEVRGA